MKNRVIAVSIFVITTIFLVNLYLNRSGSIYGKIVYENDDTVFLKEVSVTLDDTEKHTNNTLTGAYNISGVKVGKHKLKFQKDGYIDSEIDIEILAGQNKEVNARLYRKEIKEAKTYSGYNIITTDSDSNSVSIINLNENKKITSIVTGDKPIQTIVVPEKNKIYISHLNGNNVAIIDSNNFQKVKSIYIGENTKPTFMQISPQKDKIFVLNSETGIVSLINTTTDEAIKDYIDLKDQKKTRNIFFNTSDSLLYLIRKNTVYSFYENIERKKYDLKKDLYECNADYYPNENKLIITDKKNKELILLDILSGEESRISLNSEPISIIVEKSGFNAYILFSDYISIFNLSRKEFVKEQIPTGGSGASYMTLSNDKSKIIISNEKTNDFSIFDIQSEKMLDNVISVGKSPSSVSIWSLN